jgi:hypothetical protein
MTKPRTWKTTKKSRCGCQRGLCYTRLSSSFMEYIVSSRCSVFRVGFRVSTGCAPFRLQYSTDAVTTRSKGDIIERNCRA